MPNKDTPYQTLGEFMNSPFGVSTTETKATAEKYEEKYKQLAQEKKIYCENWTESDGMYMIHIKVPSESQNGLWYDVVVQFFTDDEQLAKQNNLERYYIQFFSNSPSFIYQYAALYKVHGYLIDSLYDKMDPEYSNMLPDKVNPDYKMSYDKSLFFACRFLQDNNYNILRKTGIRLYKKVNMMKFLRSIKDYEMVKADSELYSIEQSLKKETEKEKALAKQKRKEFVDKMNPFSRNASKVPKKKAKYDTVQDGQPHAIHTLKKRKPGRSTVTSTNSEGKLNRSVHVVTKKKGKTTTRKLK